MGDVKYEVLIWDNHSEDGSYDWLYEYAKADCRITKIFAGEKNYGLEAINFLAEEAKSDFILKVDDDIIVPKNFAQDLVDAYVQFNHDKLLYLGYDMHWGNTESFALRSGKKLYKNPLGTTHRIDHNKTMYICYKPDFWMVNGVCRLSPREQFLKAGGHPKGVIYGSDRLISKAAGEAGYWIGYLNTKTLVTHMGISDSHTYRSFKDRELQRVGSPLHV